MKVKFLLIVVCLVLFISFPLLSLGADEKPTVATKVMLGLTIDGQGSIVAADPQIEYVYPGIEKLLTPDIVFKSVRYLPPLSVNHENLITGVDVVPDDYKTCTVSLHDAFRLALKKYGKITDPENYILLTAKRSTPESRPLMSVWWFSFIHKDALPKPK
jgi:hypothetical protein